MHRSTIPTFSFLRDFCRNLAPFVFAFCCLLTSSLHAQTKKCVADKREAIDYKLVQNYKNNLPPYIRSLRVVIKKENFNRAFMVRLANAIRIRFCSDEEISAILFDDKRVAESLDVGQFLAGRVKVPEVRGFYARTSSTSAGDGSDEFVQFSTERGNPTNEVIIKLPQN